MQIELSRYVSAYLEKKCIQWKAVHQAGREKKKGRGEEWKMQSNA